MNRQRGAAGVEYLAAVAVVGIMFAGLLVLRPHEAPRRAPVNAISPIVRLLGAPVRNLTPRPVRPPRRPGPRRPSPPRRAPRAEPPSTVLLPEWWGRR